MIFRRNRKFDKYQKLVDQANKRIQRKIDYAKAIDDIQVRTPSMKSRKQIEAKIVELQDAAYYSQRTQFTSDMPRELAMIAALKWVLNEK